METLPCWSELTYPIRIATVMGVSGVFQAPPVAVSSLFYHRCPFMPLSYLPFRINIGGRRHGNGRISRLVFVNKEESPSTSTSISTPLPTQEQTEQGDDPDPQDLEYVAQIKTVTSSPPSLSFIILLCSSYFLILMNFSI